MTIAIALIGAICILGCSEAKRIAKAEQTVLTNKDAFQRVGTKFLDLNPCVSDSIVVSKVDTVTTVTTEFIKGDTVITKDTVRITLPSKVIINTIRLRDTVKVTIVDRSLLRMQQDSTRKYFTLYLSQREETQKQLAAANDAKGSAKARLWMLIGLGVVVVGGGFLAIKSKILSI